jgi:phosphoglycerate dehydrogenase-like enzyme
MALLLASARRLGEAQRYVRAGRWTTWGPRLLIGADFADATLGIIGFGRIGQAVARRAQGFGMRVRYHDPAAEPAWGALPLDLATLLRESDFVTLHVPLNPQTHHLINSATLGQMKPSAVLVNTARGPVVDHGALLEALRAGRLAAAGLDVSEPEPLPGDHPLLQLENCIVLPHVASASKRSRDMMARMAAQNLIAGLRGERLPNCANPEVYELGIEA